MKARNPWIDARVTQVRSASARAYLLSRGWKALRDGQENFMEYELPGDGSDRPTVRVPLLEQGRDYPQRIIEMVADLALAEGRSGAAVLDDMLKQPPTDPCPANGAIAGEAIARL